MKKELKLKALLIKRYSDEEILKSYEKNYKKGLWKSEEIIIKKIRYAKGKNFRCRLWYW